MVEKAIPTVQVEENRYEEKGWLDALIGDVESVYGEDVLRGYIVRCMNKERKEYSDGLSSLDRVCQ